MRTHTSHKRLLQLAIVLLPFVTAGCMIEPREGQQYPSRSTPIGFYGYINVPNAPVKISAQTWNNLASCGSNVGYWNELITTTSNNTPLHDGNGVAWYRWQVTTTVPTNSWCLTPGPGLGELSYSTNITGIYRYDPYGDKWRTLQTSDEDTVSCSTRQPNNSGFLAALNCSRIHEQDAHAVQIWAE